MSIQWTIILLAYGAAVFAYLSGWSAERAQTTRSFRTALLTAFSAALLAALTLLVLRNSN